MTVRPNFRLNGSWVRCSMGDCRQRARILNDAICLASSRGNPCLSGGRTGGHRHAAITARPITITVCLAILIEILMNAGGSSGIVGTGWGDECRNWMRCGSAGGGRFGGTRVPCAVAVPSITRRRDVGCGSGRRFYNGRMIRLFRMRVLLKCRFHMNTKK